jgi:hypothetical protein
MIVEGERRGMDERRAIGVKLSVQACKRGKSKRFDERKPGRSGTRISTVEKMLMRWTGRSLTTPMVRSHSPPFRGTKRRMGTRSSEQ